MMKRFIERLFKPALVFVGAVLLMVGVVSAAPNTDFSWTEPTQYEDGNVIPATDILSYTLQCGNTSGGPYNFQFAMGSSVSTANVDVGACVGGVPGTYYFVATATSADFNTESVFSNEASRTYTAADLGKVPLPPTLFTIQ